ncbi:MAG TPA: ABC transporter permease [Chloroflexota bacterium]|nr:ABC transporter permease [Chloroflexota bacterium]
MTAGQTGHAILAQAATEMRLTMRRGESVLVTIIIPAALLIFFASARVLPSTRQAVDFLVPGTLALAVISTGLVSLGIATAYERYYGVLKRYGSTPFPRWALIAAKLLSVAMIEAVQVAMLIAIAFAGFGWRPHGSLLLVLLALVLGNAAFAGLGLTLAGALRAEATLAGANGLFLLFLLLGGLFAPLDHLPSWLVPVARVLPAAALADVLRSVLQSGSHLPQGSGLLLVAWAIAMPVVAALTFRWE